MFRVLLNHILPFVAGCLSGLAVFYLVTPIDVPAPNNTSGSSWGSGSSSSYCKGRKTFRGIPADTFNAVHEDKPAIVTLKPQAEYTDEARKRAIEGTVVLRVTLLDSGEVGPVEVLRGLPGGLTEQAIAAARRIEFEPKRVDGKAVAVTRTVEYRFDIY